MGCGASKAKYKVEVAPGDEPESKPPPPKGRAPTAVEAASPSAAGGHWAEGGDGKVRRDAAAPWQGAPAAPASSAQDVMNNELNKLAKAGATMEAAAPAAAKATDSFDFQCAFPMYLMSMDTFLGLEMMQPHEDLMAKGLLYEWKPEMSNVFFFSHQWVSFTHPDPAAEQLGCAQRAMRNIVAGKVQELFTTNEEWEAFKHKDPTRLFGFSEVDPESLAQLTKTGHVWLDYASVPQAAAAEEARLAAIDSIPFYIDNAYLFIALVPPVEHKDLPGVLCDYKSWSERGWCRLETQVHEVRRFAPAEGEIMPGFPRFEIPLRPLVLHSADCATSYDMFDNFYMNWQRKCSVFNGQFACCRLNHEVKQDDGSIRCLPCDKKRIQPLVGARPL
jgi:hypothetical protein